MLFQTTKKQVFAYFIGLFILGFAINCAIIADIGVGCWDSAYVALSQILSLSVGTLINIFAFIFLIVSAMIEKKRIKIECLFTSIIIGVSVDFWKYVLFNHLTALPLGIRIFLLVVNIALIGIGAGLYLASRLPANPIDHMMMAIIRKYKLSITVSKIICEGSGLLIGLLFHGPIAVGTIILLFAYGPAIQACHPYFDQLINNEQTNKE